MLRSFLIGSGETSRATDLGLLILRLGVGVTLALGHGLGKLPPSDGFIAATGSLGFPAPALFAWLAALAEFGGGLLLALGLLTRPAALAVAFTMAVAFFGQHAGDAFADRELALVYGVAALSLLASGSGMFSVDAALRRRWLG